jgi:hypothetical protein
MGRIVQKMVPGGHIGLFMGAHTLKEHWPQIAQEPWGIRQRVDHSFAQQRLLSVGGVE